MSVFDRLTQLLDHHRVPYDVLRHDPVFTSEEAARVRGAARLHVLHVQRHPAVQQEERHQKQARADAAKQAILFGNATVFYALGGA